MKRLRQILAFVAFCCFTWEMPAQQGNFVFGLEGWSGYTSNGTVPFWLRSNQFGSVPLDGASLSLIGFARKDFEPGKEKFFDWGASFEGRANLGQGINLSLIEGYGKMRLGIFELRAGRSKKITGLCDTTLTSGSWSISGTNFGIPEVELSVRDFWTIPWFGELFAFKGNFSHGWMGNVKMRRWFDDNDTVQIKTYLHQKSLYGRFGRPSWKLKIYGGFNHQVTWGNEDKFYTRDFDLSPILTYGYVLTGKRYNNGFIDQTRLGNHMGSLDLGLEYRFKNIEVLIYRQSFYEGGALSKLANIQDGLNGISVSNIMVSDKLLKWNKILLELLYTVNQAGEPWSPEYGSFYEGYYNHGEYVEGWAYKGKGLGTPFISTINEVRTGLPSGPEEYFINNRVIAVHCGLEGSVGTVSYILKASWSENYGTYWTTNEEQTTGLPNPGAYGIFGSQRQFSAFLDLEKSIKQGFTFGLAGAYDHGTLLNNSIGLFLKASYSFRL
jgi:hypothetical protein